LMKNWYEYYFYFPIFRSMIYYRVKLWNICRYQLYKWERTEL
jgi:hypothetical protein